MHYVIGDVHGHYNTLKDLVKALPGDAGLIFVGDLIDRGTQSAEVVRFVRQNGHRCVMGNHEALMVTYGSEFISAYRRGQPLPQYNLWYVNGGIHTLLSYGVAVVKEGRLEKAAGSGKQLERLEDDLRWMQTLPLYIELGSERLSGKPVVVSHAPLASVWQMRHDEALFDTFSRTAMTSRRDPDEEAEIFNIFGHTPVKGGADVQPHYVNIDTGCYKEEEEGYRRLSAYCVESGEVVSVACRG
jgi:serine/threonine protein phosphatase 1